MVALIPCMSSEIVALKLCRCYAHYLHCLNFEPNGQKLPKSWPDDQAPVSSQVLGQFWPNLFITELTWSPFATVYRKSLQLRVGLLWLDMFKIDLLRPFGLVTFFEFRKLSRCSDLEYLSGNTGRSGDNLKRLSGKEQHLSRNEFLYKALLKTQKETFTPEHVSGWRIYKNGSLFVLQRALQIARRYQIVVAQFLFLLSAFVLASPTDTTCHIQFQ
jgi:hypothetical protein